jgi:tRNA U34 5-carboxymethylaminomethyl modifying GTPase MnmE/TrmE
MLETLLIYGAYSLLRSWLSSSSTSSTIAVPSLSKAPSKVITFVGRTGVGKSSTANALVGSTQSSFQTGAEHGTTTTIVEQSYRQGYRLRDTPGLLDTIDYTPIIWKALEDSELVIYTTTGQLYRPELAFLEHIHASQRQWNLASGTLGRRQLALYINMQDVKDGTMPSAVRNREVAAIQAQVSAWIPTERIVIGAAAPVRHGVQQPARIDDLRSLIQMHIDQHL